jgi:predicted nucleic acid-binding protein
VTGFLLDTNVLSEFARTGEPDRHVDRWLKTTAEEYLFASVLTFAEIRRGIELLPEGKRRAQLEQWQDDLVASFETRLFPVTKGIADRWAVLSAQTQRNGITLANIDGLIAATALEHDLTLVTRNVKDFAGVAVPLFNPWEAGTGASLPPT